jgi:hypothetical protein
VNRVALTIQQVMKCQVQRGYSKYGLCMNIFYRNSGQFTTQRTVIDEVIIAWWDLKFRTRSARKIKYGVRYQIIPVI